MYLQIENLFSTYGSSARGVLDVSLEAAPGEVIAILGRNGAGKTTLIQTLLDWKEPNSRTMKYFGGKSLRSHRETILQRIGYVADEPMLIESYTVEQMIAMIRDYYINWDRNREKELLEKFSLEKETPIQSLSRGMKTKLSLLLALCHHPDLLIMDEATSGLDPAVREEILNMLVQYCSSGAKTVLYATHLLDEVNRIATRVLILDQGRLKFESSTGEMEERIFSVSSALVKKQFSDVPTGSLFTRNQRSVFDAKNCSQSHLDVLRKLEPEALRLDELFIGLTEE